MESNMEITIESGKKEYISNFANILVSIFKGSDINKEYKNPPILKLEEDLTAALKNDTVHIEGAYYNAREVAEVIAKGHDFILMNLDKDTELTAKIYVTDTYESVYFDIIVKDGKFILDSRLYPYGYSEEIECDECGEVIIERSEWNGETKMMECPECGTVKDVAAEILSTQENIQHLELDLE